LILALFQENIFDYLLNSIRAEFVMESLSFVISCLILLIASRDKGDMVVEMKSYIKEVQDKKKLESAAAELSLIAGQKAVKTKARISIAGFKIREGMEIGCKVTLRGNRMYTFLEKLITIALPRVKDFKGVKANGCDGRGSFSMGIQEHLIFPEIDFDKINEVRGLNITFVTNTKNDADTMALLEKFEMPFVKKRK
jgi:large subunit ribosomal protein L5